MSSGVKRWIKNLVRWAIAIGGIAIVLYNISLRDRVWVLGLNDTLTPEQVTLRAAAPDPIPADARLSGLHPRTHLPIEVGREQLVNKVERQQVTLRSGERATVVAADVSDEGRIRRLLVTGSSGAGHRWIAPAVVEGRLSLRVVYPLVDPGLATMVARARPLYLWTAVAIFPVVFLITAYRWQQLLRAVQIALPFGRTFALNMVGAFYNSFMPGSTGGDLLKAYYAAKQTPHRTRAVLSVIIDRAIGLLALVLLGGSMAAYSWVSTASTGNGGDDSLHDATRKSMQIAIGSAAIVLAVLGGLAIFYIPMLRRLSGMDFLLRRLPMQTQVRKAEEAMQMYRRRPGLVLAAIAMTFPVHGTVVVSAMLCGMAFDLPIPWWYYFVAVPVIVLSGSIPISPQGAGVMEFFAIVLTRRLGCTIGQAFALTMSIRIVQMLWNLTGGFFVLRGGYHAPTEKEQETLSSDDDVATTATAASQ
jgi:hypothetical protein